jgi:hypothetical protein
MPNPNPTEALVTEIFKVAEYYGVSIEVTLNYLTISFKERLTEEEFTCTPPLPKVPTLIDFNRRLNSGGPR